jgi:hypothetical protein
MNRVDALKIVIHHVFLIAMSGALLCGCTTEQISRNVYEGVKNHNEAIHSAPPDYTAPRAPSYDDYDRERRALEKR